MSTQTLGGPPATTIFPMGVECRVSERHACGLKASCQPVAARGDDELSWPAEIRDVSLGGVGLVLKRRFERGAGLAVEIPATAKAPAETLLARVVHVTRLPGQGWLLGCAFISELSEDELQRLLVMAKTSRPGGDEPDSLVEDHHPDSCNTLVLPVAPENGQGLLVPEVTWEGIFAGKAGQKRISRLHLKGEWPLIPGTIVRVWFGQQPQFKIRLTVKDCYQQDGRWYVEYTFADPPPAELRRLLGF